MELQPDWRVVGNLPDDIKKEIKENMAVDFLAGNDLADFSQEVQELIKNNEIPKTTFEERAIEIANNESNKLMEECGIKPYDIPFKNIHILPSDIYKKITNNSEHEDAITYASNQNIFFDEQVTKSPHLIKFWMYVFHEMLHAKAHLTLHGTIEGEDADTIKINKKNAGQAFLISFSSISARPL